MKNIAVVFGGNSFEKDVSIITACQAMKNMDKKKYKIWPIILENSFKLVENGLEISSYINEYKTHEVVFLGNKLFRVKKKKFKYLINIDAVLNCCHGGYGEDGTLKGFFDILNIPVVSSSVSASNIGMYKNLTKCFLNENKIKHLKGIYIKKGVEFDDVINKIEFPCIVKPNSLGSSIGIKIVDNKNALIEAINEIFALDNEIIIEKYLDGFKEYNIAAFKANGKVILSQIEEIESNNYLDFDEKYLNANAKRKIPANISENIDKKIRNSVLKIYDKLDVGGVCRFDFLEKDNSVYLNEFNTIPGSLAYYLFKGLEFKDLIEILIEEACDKNNKNSIKEYKSDVLKFYNKNQNTVKMHK